MKGLKRGVLIFLILTLSICFRAWSSEVFIDKEMVDLKQICKEEKLSEKNKLERIYIFLAILNGNTYDVYAARGDSDLDKDGKNVIQEPNNLAGYMKIGASKVEKLSIDKDEHTCYITNMPKYKDLFPDDKETLPDDFMIGIPTQAKVDQKARLTGTKTLPVITPTGSSTGIERFFAFYNKKGSLPSGDPKDATKVNEADKNVVTSFGFLAIRINDMEETE